MRARLKRFCCPTCCPPYCLSLQDDLDINFEAKKQEVPKITSPNLDYPALSDALLVTKSYEKGWLSTKDPTPIAEQNPWLCFSKKIKETTFNLKGRHLVAARDIPVGEMLVVEEPLCSILAPEKLGMTFNCLVSQLFRNLVNVMYVGSFLPRSFVVLPLIVVGLVILLCWIVILLCWIVDFQKKCICCYYFWNACERFLFHRLLLVCSFIDCFVGLLIGILCAASQKMFSH